MNCKSIFWTKTSKILMKNMFLRFWWFYYFSIRRGERSKFTKVNQTRVDSHINSASFFQIAGTWSYFCWPRKADIATPKLNCEWKHKSIFFCLSGFARSVGHVFLFKSFSFLIKIIHKIVNVVQILTKYFENKFRIVYVISNLKTEVNASKNN